jgi:hypothetical protein
MDSFTLVSHAVTRKVKRLYLEVMKEGFEVMETNF